MRTYASQPIVAAALLVTAMAVSALATHRRDPVSPEPVMRARRGRPTARAARALSRSHPIDLNSASPGDLELLPGIGPKLSERIVEYRKGAGDFRQVEDLVRVSGIGPKTLERLRPFITVAATPTTATTSTSTLETATSGDRR